MNHFHLSRHWGIAFVLLLFYSCKSFDSKFGYDEDSLIKKKCKVNLSQQEAVITDTLSFQSSVQSDFDIMLFNHVVMSADSFKFIMTYDDCKCLGIPAENHERMRNYVDSLNAVARQRRNTN